MKWFNLEDNINLLTFIGAIAILTITAVVVIRLFGTMKDKSDKGELSEHSWDGIGEYKNPLPFGWAICFAGVIIWAIWYILAGYPLNSYSQIGQYNEEIKAYNDKFEAKFASVSGADLVAMGEQVFLVQCAQCHGVDANGINGKAANLNVWGGEQAIYETIINGSKGLNYPMGEMNKAADLGIDDATAKAIAAYVAAEISAIKKTKMPELVAAGKEAFGICASCHGEDGKGMDGMSPDLSKYGSIDFVVDVLNRGKSGFIGLMPSFANSGVLNATQQKAVGAYINSLKGE